MVFAQRESPIFQAHWEGVDRGMIALAKDWVSRVQKPPLFLGPEKRPFARLEPVPPLTFGRMAGYCRLGQKLSFLLPIEDAAYTGFADSAVYVAGDFNDWKPFDSPGKWRLEPTRIEDEEFLVARIPSEVYDEGQRHQFKFVTSEMRWIPVSEAAPNAVESGYGGVNFELNPFRTGRHLFAFELPRDHVLMGNEEVIWAALLEEDRHKLPPTVHFHDLESERDPGVFPEESRTTFRIFAPRADRVLLEWSRVATPWEPKTVELEAVGRGLWEGVVEENLCGGFYFYRVSGENRDRSTHFDPDFRLLDPYAKAVVSRNGPAIVVDPERLRNPHQARLTPPVADLVIAEAHVRDLVAKAPVDLTPEERRGFAGVTKLIRSGRSYLAEIGVNAIEFQPIQEFDNETPEEYHWGYMTVNWFAPESSYGSDPLRACQIEEFREMVAACHEAGFSVILDVVYNHVGEPNNLLFIDKFYYLETAPRFHLMNWSGCGNDFRSTTPMGRKLIIDSLLHLVRAYGVDGFRFDLADLLGKQTLVAIEEALRAEKPDVVLITEPWSFRGHIANELRDTTWSSWSDGFRKFAGEYVNGSGNQDGIKHFLGGSVGGAADHPYQTINYTESHDDRTWIDRITERPDFNGFVPTGHDIRRTHLMMALLFASLGPPMIAAGQDFLRSKHGYNNSYQRGDLNAIDYTRAAEYSLTHGYVRSWIHFRLSSDGAALRIAERREEDLAFTVAEGSSAVLAIYNPERIRNVPRLAFAINPHHDGVSLPTAGFPLRDWTQIADTWRLEPEGLVSALTPVGRDSLHLPPHSCGLWIDRNS